MKEKVKPWYASTGERYIGVPNYLYELKRRREITETAFLVGVYLCMVADYATGEVTVKSTTFIADAVNSHQKNVMLAIDELEREKFLLRDSGAKGRQINRYKLFSSFEDWDENYLFFSRVPVRNKKALPSAAPKESGEPAAPKVSRAGDATSRVDFPVMWISEQYLRRKFFGSPILLDDSQRKEDPGAEGYTLIPIDLSTFNDLRQIADRDCIDFPESFLEGFEYGWGYFK